MRCFLVPLAHGSNYQNHLPSPEPHRRPTGQPTPLGTKLTSLPSETSLFRGTRG